MINIYLNNGTNGREYLQKEVRRFLEEHRKLYPSSRPGASNFIKWRALQEPELLDEAGNGYNMVWPAILVQAEIQLALPRVHSQPLAAAVNLGSKKE